MKTLYNIIDIKIKANIIWIGFICQNQKFKILLIHWWNVHQNIYKGALWNLAVVSNFRHWKPLRTFRSTRSLIHLSILSLNINNSRIRYIKHILFDKSIFQNWINLQKKIGNYMHKWLRFAKCEFMISITLSFIRKHAWKPDVCH